jgi:dihydropyrimidinase/dihydroorotase
MTANFVIKNGKVVTPSGVIENGAVAVDKGKITVVGSEAVMPGADRVIDARGNFLLPGVIDMHTHPGSGYKPPADKLKDDFRTESEGALYGGTTTMKSMLSFLEPVLPQLDRIIEWANTSSYIDIILHIAIQDQSHLNELPEYWKRGITGTKLFFTAYKGREGEELGQRNADSGIVYKICEWSAKMGYPALPTIHCEEQDICDVLRENLMQEGKNGLPSWTDARPNFVEAMAVEAAAWVAQATGARINIAHVSTRESVNVIEEWQKRGVQVFAETTPHYLILNRHMSLGKHGKIGPPLRDPADNARLWEGLRQGIITTMGSDHLAYGAVEAKITSDDIWTSMLGWGGGIEVMLPLLWTEGVMKGRISLETLVRITSENCAKLAGVYPKKGALIPGADADIVVVDPRKEKILRAADLHCKSRDYGTAFEGRKVQGIPVLTMTKGAIAMEDGQTVAKPGVGKFLPCSKF